MTVAAAVRADTFNESFTGTTAPGWTFGANPGDTLPVLTATTVDTPGTGWLRLNTNTPDQSTSALLDTEIFSVNAQIQIEMEYSFFNGSGADGITFFLVDGTVDASTFTPGAYGGSMGYAQKNAAAAPPAGEAGMPGGYLGFAFDNWGNYTNNNEGRVGGVAGPGSSPVDTTLRPNRIAVRGPESSQYAYIASSADLSGLPGGGQMDFPTYTTRPVQTGADYRQFRLTIDANNQLTVEMKFGASAGYITAFTADLSAYERPDTFKIGFTGATGGANEIHEIRNLQVTTTPWSTGSGAYEWDNGAGTTAWGGTPAGANANWYSSVSGDDDKTPVAKSDVLFGDKPANNGTDNSQLVDLSANVEVRNLTFDSGINYTIGTSGDTPTITFGKNSAGVGLPSINVNNYNDAYARHKINSNVVLAEDIAVRNFSYSTLCINGAITTGGNDITTSGYGATNFNGVISGTGDFIANGSSMIGTGSGIVTISGDNAATWTGDVTVNGGQLVVLHNNALGATGQSTVVNDGGTLTFRGGISTAEPLTIRGSGTTLGRGELGGALFNDGGANTLSGAVTLGANAAVRSRDGNLTLSGVVSDGASTYGLTKLGEGVVTLSNSGNNYNGATTISDGALRITTSSAALAGGFTTNGYTGGNLTLAGGVLEIGVNTTFARGIGSGSDQVQWTGDGGFSAYGGNRTVTLNNGTGNVTWGSASFVGAGYALLLGSDASDSRVSISNDLSFDNAQREVRVADGSATVDARLRGRLRGGNNAAGTGGLVKTGDGTLELNNNSGTASDYSGATEIRGGALRITNTDALSANSNFQLNGGVLDIGMDMNGGTAGDYSPTLGAAAANLQWTGDGGFAATTAARTVSLNAGAALTWGATSGFVSTSNTLRFGSSGADNTVTLANAIDLGASGTRTIKTTQGTNTAIASGVLSGVVSGAANLSVNGNGRLDLAAANTNTGTLAIIGSEVRLGGAGTMASAAGYTIQQGGTLTLDNTSANNTDRVSASAVSLSGGTVSFLGQTGNVDSSETAGALSLAGGGNTITVARGDATGSATLTFASLSRTAGATLDVTNPAGTLGTIGDNPRLAFTTAPTLDDGILAYATVNGTDFAAHSSVDGTTPDGIGAYSGSLTTGEANWTSSTVNAAPAADATLTAARTINSLKLASGIDVTQAGFSLTLQSGGLLTTGATAVTVSGGSLTTGNSNDLVVHAYNTGGTTIGSTLTGSGGLTKSGSATLTLSGTTANTLTGTSTVNAGTLVLDKSDGVNALAGDLVIGDGRGIDTVRLDSNEQIADSATVSLVGGESGNSANVARLELNGSVANGDPAGQESFATLNVSGNSVLDFHNGTVCSPTKFSIDVLNVLSGALLTIEDWIEATDLFLVKKTSLDSPGEQAQLARVVFDGYGGSASWKNYDSDYYQIVPYSPVPEPSTYGLLALGGLGAFVLCRRRHRTGS